MIFQKSPHEIEESQKVLVFSRFMSFVSHKKIARIAFPIWLYVTITGVVVYLMISPYYT